LSKNPKIPFTDEVFATFDETVEKFLNDHPINTLNDITDLKPSTWENESFEIASTMAYIDV
jgi:hypothetical protein